MNNDTRDDDIDDIDTLIEEDDDDSLTTKWLDEIEAHNMNYDSFYKDDVFFIKFCNFKYRMGRYFVLSFMSNNIFVDS